MSKLRKLRAATVVERSRFVVLVSAVILAMSCGNHQDDQEFVQSRIAEGAREWRENSSADIAVLQEVVAKGDKAVPYVIASLNSSDADQRWLSIYLLGAMDAKESALHILPLLEDESFEVQTAAASQLGRFKAKAAVPGLIQLIRTGDDGPCSAAATSLGLIGDRSAVSPLVENLVRHENMGTQQALIGALKSLVVPSDLSVLQKELRSLESRQESRIESGFGTAIEGLQSLIRYLRGI